MKKTGMQLVHIFLLQIPALFFLLASMQTAYADPCTGTWHTPGTPSVYGQFGSYVKVKSLHSASECEGHATRNAATGTWQTYPTKQTSDGYNSKSVIAPDAQGNPREVYSDATSLMSGFNATGHLLLLTSGDYLNSTRTQDTLECSVTGAGSSEISELGFKLCYKYSTRAAGVNVYHASDDGVVNIIASNITGGGDLVVWTSGGDTITHMNGGTPVYDQCSTGYFKIVGPLAQFRLSMSTSTNGTQFQHVAGGPWALDGTVNGSFEITGSPTPSKPWTCESASLIFPGADGPTRKQQELQKESDGTDSAEKSQEAEDARLERAKKASRKAKSNDGSESGQKAAGAAKSTGYTGNGGVSPQADAAEDCGGNPVQATGQPIHFPNGFKAEHEVDYTGPAGLNFVRTYRSNGDWLTYRLGKYWRHNFDRTLTVTTVLPAIATITDENGVVTRFRQTTSGGPWKPYDFEITAKFESLYNSVPALIGYALTKPDNTKEIYNTTGKLTRIEYTGSYALNLAYDGSGRLQAVTDEHGRTMTLNYDGSGRVSTLVTPDGTYTYTYGANNNLTQVTKPDTKTRIYHYENTTFVNALTGLTDERGVREVTWAYDSIGKAISSELAGSVDDYTLTYNADGTVTATNPLGKQTKYTFQNINNVPKIISVDGQPSTNCPASAKSYAYTAEGWVASKTDWEGNVTTFTYDSRGLPTSMKQAVGSSVERTISTSWESTYRLPNVTTLGTLSVDNDYDSFGRLTKVTATDTATSATRIWTYTYWANGTGPGGQTILGRLKEIDGPRTDVTDKTTFTYDASYNLTKVTNALNQETQITARDSAGRPTTLKDVNNVQTNLTYDSNARVQTITGAVGTPLQGVTTLGYNFAGDVTSIDLPNGTTMTYTYDNARRLTKVTDDLGNSINYTLDAAGNITQTQYKDPANTLKYTHSRTFDELSRLLTSIGAGAAWSRSWSWDKNGNNKLYRDANTNETDFAYDGLQRLADTTDALNGVTDPSYNSLNQTISVKDPRNNSTAYTYNAFGDVTQINSPDTGVTNIVVDKAGNMTQRTDARGVVTNYTYDALNRLATVAYPSDTTLNVTLTYDDNPTPGNCGTSKGRLCRVVDAAGTTDYKYNALGQLIEVKEIRGALTFTTSYEYDLAGVLKKITLPSGRQVTYTLNGNGQVTSVAAPVNGTATTLASSITYLPYGPMTGLTYGNAKTLSATYDQDYRPTNRTVSGVFNHTYDTDADGNITQKGVRTYTYDVLERLNAEAGGTATSFTYDAIGNRLTEVAGGTTTYTYPSMNSKLSSVGANSYTYDGMGNVTGDGARTYVWSGAGLLKEAKIGGTTVGAYTYSANNQRTKKVAGGATTHYVYGLGGKLYGEYDNSGVLIREYIWLNGEPLAQILKSGATEAVTYLHTDHLATPRYGTNAAGSTVWTWDSGAFGKEAPTGTVTVNLRFPGQYFDSETTLFYNWNRYYNPAIGRYISSDPIGLAGGLATYNYVSASPVMFSDPEGLDVKQCRSRFCLATGICFYHTWIVTDTKAFGYGQNPNLPKEEQLGSSGQSSAASGSGSTAGPGAETWVVDHSNYPQNDCTEKFDNIDEECVNSLYDKYIDKPRGYWRPTLIYGNTCTTFALEVLSECQIYEKTE